MKTTKEVKINGRTYTIAQLTADVAFDVFCVVAEWRGKQMEAIGDAALSPDAKVGSQTAGRVLTTIAKMLRDPDYRESVWTTVLGVCSCDGVPVLRGDWKTTYMGDRLGDLYLLHLASIDWSCSSFLGTVGIGAPPSQDL